MKKILIIDDEAEICELTSSVLRRTGRYEVQSSTSPRQGIELARSFKPDLILLDMLMSEMDGTETAKILCETPETSSAHIVFVTAIAVPMVFLAALVENEALKQKAGQFGGHYFIQKPIAAQELIARVDEILKGA